MKRLSETGLFKPKLSQSEKRVDATTLAARAIVDLSPILADLPAKGERPRTVYRQQGDRNILVEYGPIVLRQDGHLIHGCYNNGDGQLEGMILGRVMRLAWYMPKEKSIGMATLVADGNQLYGFWYRDQDRMGSPWNAVKVPDSDKSDRGPCGSLLPR